MLLAVLMFGLVGCMNTMESEYYDERPYATKEMAYEAEDQVTYSGDIETKDFQKTKQDVEEKIEKFDGKIVEYNQTTTWDKYKELVPYVNYALDFEKDKVLDFQKELEEAYPTMRADLSVASMGDVSEDQENMIEDLKERLEEIEDELDKAGLSGPEREALRDEESYIREQLRQLTVDGRIRERETGRVRYHLSIEEVSYYRGEKPGFWQMVSYDLKGLKEFFAGVVVAAVYFVVGMLPLALVAVVVIWAYRKKVRK